MISSPSVVGSPTVAGEGAPEVGCREGRNFVVDPQGLKLAIEGIESIVNFSEHGGLKGENIGVMVPAAPLHEEGLADSTHGVSSHDGAGNLLKLTTD